VQVDSIKPTLKAPEIKLLKLECDDLRLNFAFKFNLRRYIKMIEMHRRRQAGSQAGHQHFE